MAVKPSWFTMFFKRDGVDSIQLTVTLEEIMGLSTKCQLKSVILSLSGEVEGKVVTPALNMSASESRKISVVYKSNMHYSHIGVSFFF